MKLALPDNGREALQFLALGVGSLLVLRLGYWALQTGLSPENGDVVGQLTSPFRRGYILSDVHSVVPDRTPTIGRLSLAVVLGMAGGAVAAWTTGLVQRIRGRQRTAARWKVFRLVLMTLSLVGMSSALCLPPRRIHLASDGVSVAERPAIGVLGLPVPSHTVFTPWSEVGIRNTVQGDRPACIELNTRSGDVNIETTGSDAEIDALYFWMGEAKARDLTGGR